MSMADACKHASIKPAIPFHVLQAHSRDRRTVRPCGYTRHYAPIGMPRIASVEPDRGVVGEAAVTPPKRRV